MAKDSRLAWQVKSQMARFTGELTESLGKVVRRFVAEMLYGIQAAKDVKISNIARSLREAIPRIKTEGRLCRNLAQRDLTDGINRWLCWKGSGAVTADTVLAVDLSDLRKPYAQKMEYLATVRDGSRDELGNGYGLCDIVAADVNSDRLVPLYGELYSQEAEDFVSENEQSLKAIDAVAHAAHRRGIFVIDRGGDRRSLLIPLIDKKLRFVVRQTGARHVRLADGTELSVDKAAARCKCTLKRAAKVEREGQPQTLTLHLGAMSVRLPEKPEVALWLVVIRGFGERPIMLLTNVGPKPGMQHASWIADIYLTRCRIEETYRFLKQAYNLEDVRVRGYAALRNIYVFVNAVMCFVSAVLGAKAKLRLIFSKLCEKALRFFDIPRFFHYAIADGIHRVLFGTSPQAHLPPDTDCPGQLLLAFAKPPS